MDTNLHTLTKLYGRSIRWNETIQKHNDIPSHIARSSMRLQYFYYHWTNIFFFVFLFDFLVIKVTAPMYWARLPFASFLSFGSARAEVLHNTARQFWAQAVWKIKKQNEARITIRQLSIWWTVALLKLERPMGRNETILRRRRLSLRLTTWNCRWLVADLKTEGTIQSRTVFFWFYWLGQEF